MIFLTSDLIVPTRKQVKPHFVEETVYSVEGEGPCYTIPCPQSLFQCLLLIRSLLM